MERANAGSRSRGVRARARPGGVGRGGEGKGTTGTQGGPTRRGGRLAEKSARSWGSTHEENDGGSWGPLSVRRQCKLLGVNRNRLASSARGGLGEEGLEMARRIDELHLRFPEFGARRMSQWLLREGMEGATRGWVAQVMKAMGFPRHLKLRPGSRCAVGRRMTNKPTIGGISERIFGQRGG